MTRTNSKQSRKPARVAGVLALVLGLSLVSVYAAGFVRVASVRVSGSAVTVGLVNEGPAPVSGSVVVTAMVAGQAVTTSAPFALAANQSASVSVGLGGAVTGGITVGITDDPCPW